MWAPLSDSRRARYPSLAGGVTPGFITNKED